MLLGVSFASEWTFIYFACALRRLQQIPCDGLYVGKTGVGPPEGSFICGGWDYGPPANSSARVARKQTGLSVRALLMCAMSSV